MSRVNKTRFLVQHESGEYKCRLNESVCNLNWNWIQIGMNLNWNDDERRWECKELDYCSSCKLDYTWNPNTPYCECNKACKIDEYCGIRNCSCKKHRTGKSVLEWEDEILNITEILLNDKKVACAKNNCIFHW